jgi:hypothetical protein
VFAAFLVMKSLFAFFVVRKPDAPKAGESARTPTASAATPAQAIQRDFLRSGCPAMG